MSAAESNAITYHILDIQPGTTILVGHACCGATGIFADVIKRSNPASGFAHALTDDESQVWIGIDAFPEIFAEDIQESPLA